MNWQHVFLLYWMLIGVGLSHGAHSLDFSESNLSEVPTYPVIQSVNFLDLDRNNIDELFRHSFKNYDELIKLFLNQNWLRRMHDGTYENIHNLQLLALNRNSIVQLPANFGTSTTKLYLITLVDVIEDLHLLRYPHVFAFTGLNYLHIGWNDIENLNDSFFPPNIRCLAASWGSMNKFPPLTSLTSDIKLLEFNRHQLTVIPQKAVAGLFELYEVRLKDNKMKNFPNLSHWKKLTILHFEGNVLSHIHRQHIEGLETIREIHLTNNLLENMTDLSHLISLQQVFIGHNFITTIPVSFIEGLLNMKTLTCNENKLKLLPNISAFFPELDELYVQGNHLKTLPDLYDFPSLVRLQSAENPYECNVSLCWLQMVPWLKPSLNIIDYTPMSDLLSAFADTAVVRFHQLSWHVIKVGSF